MHRKYLIILLLIIFTPIFGQSQELFAIKEIFVKDSLPKKSASDFSRAGTFFFEDEKYTVSKTCNGEWGGTIKFKDKKTGIVYVCSATCPVVVNKLDEKYIVTSTLNHLMGSSEIIAISDPLNLEKEKKSSRKKIKRGKDVLKVVEDDGSKSVTGVEKLLNKTGVLTIASFPYKGKLYHIVSDYKRTYLATIIDSKYENICVVANERIRTYNPEVIKTTDGHFVVFFTNNETEGYLDIYNDQIDLVRYR